MRTISVTTFLALLIISACKSNTNRSATVKTADTSNRASLKPKWENDYTSPAKTLGSVRNEEGVAIGSIKFGISKKEFNRQIQEFMKSTYFENANWIGGYEFIAVDPKFENDSLYFLCLTGPPLNLDQLIDQYKSLRQTVSKKLGASLNEPGMPDNFTKGKTAIFATWEMGDRTVDIVVKNEGFLYSIRLESYQLLKKLAVEIKDATERANELEARSKTSESF